ncbi:DegT/DnrJ/EryC1/StrS family aminotransferase [Methanococcus voltae]|uniref:Glutamine--scyllo-inositol transaminase n=1 Tax=Methanococcus voltae (strain ATCC BAA-1334 / A3) TaxID=456320 RepID=D7DTX6_METV3|nr:DegT/DnrJ/EryC1/StrS family aminotransferase [Methanococcus voltae]MCS3900386.1 perosamine synthetase [Methanococcus voltae]
MSKQTEKRNISIAKPLIGDEEIESVIKVLKSGMLAYGAEVQEFEKEFANYHQTKYGLGVTNGTVALDLALKALKLTYGDEVITTPFTFIASSNAILYQGSKPVFADIDEKTYNIDPEKVMEKITPNTKAIIAVHLFGQPANVKALKEIAEDHNIYLIEDAAQAHGAEYNKKRIGGFGDFSTFSFYPTKNMTTGEGGMVLTNNEELCNRAKLIRNHGQSEKYLHTELGYNFRMTSISAAIGRAQLKNLDNWTTKRIENAKLLNNGLKGINGIITPYEDKNVKHVYHQYCIQVEDEFKLNRDELQGYLAEKGIGTGIHYPIPVNYQPLYEKMGYKEECKISQHVSERILSLPVHPSVSKEDIDYIANVFKNI